MRYSITFLFVFFFFQLLPPNANAQIGRSLGAGSLVLDDGSGHTITIETPKLGDPGYAAWLAGGGSSVWKLPIPPFPNANAGFVLPGTAAGQLLIWVPPPGGGPQGAWEPIAADSIGGLGGGGTISGSGTNGDIPIWTGAESLGNSNLKDDGTTLNYTKSNINSGATYQIGDTTVLTAPGTGNIFVGGFAGITNTTGTNNTALGMGADFSSKSRKNSTAVGANAYVTQDNSIVLGSIKGKNGAKKSVSVGIGTTGPAATLDVQTISGDALHLTTSDEDVNDILGDDWSVNNIGQLTAGGTDGPVDNAVVTLDNGHLAAIGSQPGEQVSPDTYDSNSVTLQDVLFNSYSCGSNDVAGLVDFTINQNVSGLYMQVNFNQSYSGSEAVTITPANAATAANLTSFYVQVDPFGNYFQIVDNGNATKYADYQFYYHVIDVLCNKE